MENKKETKEESKPTEDTGDGDKSSTTPTIDAARKENERMEANMKKKEELLEREEAIQSRRELGGGSEAGQQPVAPKKLTDQEYAEALQRGEVNPMKEDGFN